MTSEELVVFLSKEIYANYLEYLQDGKLHANCSEVLENKNVCVFGHEDMSIVSVEKDGKTHVNTIFIEAIHSEIYEFLKRDEKILEKITTMNSHVMYTCVFVYLCLSNKKFIKDFINLKKE